MMPACTYEKDATKIKVEKKEAIGGEDGKGLVFSEWSSEPYSVEDNLSLLYFNSSTVYGKLDKSKCYEVDTSMFRLPILGWHKNIVKAEEIKCIEPDEVTL